VRRKKDVFVKCGNLLVGDAHFLSFKVPEDWSVGPLPYETDVEDWLEINGKRWVIRGQTRICLVSGDKKKCVLLSIKARGCNENFDIESWLQKKRKAVEKKKGRKIQKSGFMLVSGHKTPYLVYSRLRKKFGFFGKESEETFLNAVLKCSKTSRTIFLDAQLSSEGSGDEKLIENLLNIFSTFTCH
jgi:hypothetical protein